MRGYPGYRAIGSPVFFWAATRSAGCVGVFGGPASRRRRRILLWAGCSAERAGGALAAVGDGSSWPGWVVHPRAPSHRRRRSRARPSHEGFCPAKLVERRRKRGMGRFHDHSSAVLFSFHQRHQLVEAVDHVVFHLLVGDLGEELAGAVDLGFLDGAELEFRHGAFGLGDEVNMLHFA